MELFKPWVYIASPYTKGDTAINTNFQCKVFNILMDGGKVWPFAPLWSHYQHTIYPRGAQDWVDWQLALLPKMNAVLRLDATNKYLNYNQHESVGADAEVDFMRNINKPVFFSVEELYTWVDDCRSLDYLCEALG